MKKETRYLLIARTEDITEGLFLMKNADTDFVLFTLHNQEIDKWSHEYESWYQMILLSAKKVYDLTDFIDKKTP